MRRTSVRRHSVEPSEPEQRSVTHELAQTEEYVSRYFDKTTHTSSQN
jgi:hypothetical protein